MFATMVICAITYLLAMACAAAIALQAQLLGGYVDRVWHLLFDACAITCWAAITVFSVACSLNFLGLA